VAVVGVGQGRESLSSSLLKVFLLVDRKNRNENKKDLPMAQEMCRHLLGPFLVCLAAVPFVALIALFQAGAGLSSGRR
jgi:hypothetical protein